jgi:hypothetical protein
MKTLALLLLWLGTLAGQAATAPAFPPGTATLVNAFTNATLDTPRGVAIADLFGTGHPALIAANFDGNDLTVLTNNGSGVFGLHATLTVGSQPCAVVATNINGSGHVDLLALNEGISTVTVLTNNGAGGFALSDAVELKSNSEDYSLAVADIYNNGKPAMITASEGNDTLTVYTNAGGGIFGSNATCNIGATVGPAFLFVTAADINGDGWVDLICASQAGTLTVLTNNGSGGFVLSDTITLKSGSEPVSVTVADIYNNGRPALISANQGLDTLIVYTNAGGGLFGSNATCHIQSGSYSLTTADINGDGFVDLICACYNPAAVSGTVIVLTNNGGGAFTAACTNNVAGNPYCVAAASLFGNGKPDLATVGGSAYLTVLSNTTAFYNRAFTVGQATNLVVTATGSPAPAFTHTSALPAGITLIDHDNGTATLTGTPVITAGGVHTINLTASNSAGTATQAVTLTINQPPVFPGYAFVPAATNALGAGPSQFTVADLFGAGQPALIVPAASSLIVYTNAGGGLFASNTSCHSTYNQISSVVAADVYGTGQPALIAVDAGSATVIVLTNNGSGLFSLGTTLNLEALPESVVTADIFGTGHPALITANDTQTLTIFTNNGSAFHLSATYPAGIEPTALVAADINGDGHVDLLCANEYSSTLTVLTNNGSGSFATSQTIALPASFRPVTLTVADIYNNGQPALITASSYYGTLLVLTNTGGGLFGSNATCNTDATLVQAADVNNDGHVDLICANNDSDQLTVLTNNGAGHFVLASANSPVYLNGEPEDLVAADINGDGRVDLLSTSPYALAAGLGALTVLTNGAIIQLTCTENAAATPYTPAPASGYPAPALSSTSGTLPGGLTYTGGTISGKPNPAPPAPTTSI